MIWLITFRCYGTRFHDPPVLEAWERRAMTETAYSLDPPARALTLQAIREVCTERGYTLFAAHVRSTHTHVVAEIDDEHPAMVTNAFKRRASKLMNAVGYDAARHRRWARHGSYVRVRKPGEAVRYVVERQGLPMDVFVGECSS